MRMAAIRTIYNCVKCDLGAYLGMYLVRDSIKRIVTIWQPGYLEDWRDQSGITSTTVPLTPMVDKERETISESNPRLDAAGTRLYQSKVGSVDMAADSLTVVVFIANHSLILQCLTRTTC